MTPSSIILASALSALPAPFASASSSERASSSSSSHLGELLRFGPPNAVSTATGVGDGVGAGGIRGRAGVGEGDGTGSRRRLQAFQACTDSSASFGGNVNAPGRCIENWTQREWHYYPEDFEGITNFYRHYECPASGRRILLSNGMPDHDVNLGSRLFPCEHYYRVELPLAPTKAAIPTEHGESDIIALAVNGVPIFGALEALGGDAVKPDLTRGAGGVPDARYWYGHASGRGKQHYHHPMSGQYGDIDKDERYPSNETLLAYALDGFPIFGPLEDPDSVLDECNGRTVDGEYRYHVRTSDQVLSEVDGVDYCADPGNSPVVNWKYILGCFHGDMSNTTVTPWYSGDGVPDFESIPEGVLYDDCELVEDPPSPRPPKWGPRPNIVVFQPDDMPFFDEWAGNPPNVPSRPDDSRPYPGISRLPNINRLRTEGIEMTQAYASSPACTTSRYSTMTGRYPSRSSYSRKVEQESGRPGALADVTIPNTKLEDVEGFGMDCSAENMAAEFKKNGYRTGVVGKWHLHTVGEDYNYAEAVQGIKDCGFDFADAISIENLRDEVTGQTWTHNMEWVTKNALRFIDGDYETDDGTKGNSESNAEEQSDREAPFFLYFNPTAVHSSGVTACQRPSECDRANPPEQCDDEDFCIQLQSIDTALRYADCKDTADLENPLEVDPMIKGMTLAHGSCAEYRKTVRQRADGERENEPLGSIWVDDALGALMMHLKDIGAYDNTIILFQMDHGTRAKKGLWENGSRIAQFVHWPEKFGTEGMKFDGLVSNVDVAPTLFRFARIYHHYDLDGRSWADAVDGTNRAKREMAHLKDWRCVLTEFDLDRAVRCGCNKYLRTRFGSTTAQKNIDQGYGYPEEERMYFDLCDDDGEYVTFEDLAPNPEAVNLLDSAEDWMLVVFRKILQCHRDKTSALEGAEMDYYTDCSDIYINALTCGCRDIEGQFLTDEGMKDCSWVAEDLEARCGGRNVDDEANQNYGYECMETCGYCEGNQATTVMPESGWGCAGNVKRGRKRRGNLFK